MIASSVSQLGISYLDFLRLFYCSSLDFGIDVGIGTLFFGNVIHCSIGLRCFYNDGFRKFLFRHFFGLNTLGSGLLLGDIYLWVFIIDIEFWID